MNTSSKFGVSRTYSELTPIADSCILIEQPYCVFSTVFCKRRLAFVIFFAGIQQRMFLVYPEVLVKSVKKDLRN